jgi:hypothetical protein
LTDDGLAGLERRAASLGLDVELQHVNTAAQLAFAAPVRSLDSWRAVLRHEGRRVAYGDGVTQAAAVRDALAKFERARESR